MFLYCAYINQELIDYEIETKDFNLAELDKDEINFKYNIKYKLKIK
jgi:hypothetical protein